MKAHKHTTHAPRKAPAYLALQVVHCNHIVHDIDAVATAQYPIVEKGSRREGRRREGEETEKRIE